MKNKSATSHRTKLLLAPLNKKELTRLSLATEENYERAIWESINSYNYKAQLDVAELLYKNFKELKTKSPDTDPLLYNLVLRALQLYLEVADQFSLVCMSILNKHQTPVSETYIESNNVDTRTFFRICAQGKITTSQIEEIWGLDKLKSSKINKVRQAKLKVIFDQIVKTEKGNMQAFGKTYASYDTVTGKTSYTSAVKGSFAIKHGFKLVSPTNLSKQIWGFEDDDPTIFQEIKDIETKDGSIKTQIITVGSVLNDKTQTLDSSFQHLLKLIRFLAHQIGAISEAQLHLPDDPFYTIGYLSREGVVKFGRNEKCFCGSDKKYKKCHEQ